MSQVWSSFKSAVGVAVDVPAHALVVLLVSVLSLVASLVFAFIPLVGPLVSSVLVTPLVIAAVTGSADAARLGEKPLNGLQRGIEDAGLSLVGAFGLLYAAMLALVLVVVVGAAIVGTFVLGLGSEVAANGVQQAPGALSGAVGVVGVLFALVVLLAVLAVSLAVQFVGPAAVVAGTGAVDSLTTSVRLVRRNPLGVLGFSAVLLLVMLAAYAVVGVLFVAVVLLVDGAAADGLVGLGLAGLGYLIVFPLVGSVLTLYQVCYFDAVADESVLPGDDEPTPGDGPGEAVDDDSASATESASEAPDVETGGFEFGDGHHGDDNGDGDDGESRPDER